MDKYEYKVRSEEISKLIDKEKYAEAVKIADTIDWRRVKSAAMLLKIAALYRVSRRNEDSREMLMLAYERYPTNRSVVYSLCELSIELDDVVAAIEYYKQFVKLAPKDNGVYTLRYRILEAQEASLEERIEILEELKKKDYQEEWAYELAYLYHRVGLSTKCVEECDDIILWFGDGPYVMKAMELKAKHVPLTAMQQQNYEIMLGNAGQNYSNGNYDTQNYDSGDYDGQNYNAEDYTEQNYNPDGYAEQNYNGGGYDGQSYGDADYAGQDYGAYGYQEQSYGNENYDTQDYDTASYNEQHYGERGYDIENDSNVAYGNGYEQQNYADESYGNGYEQQNYASESYGNGYEQENYAGESYADGYEQQNDPDGQYIDEGYNQQNYAGGYGQEDYSNEQYAQNNFVDDGYGNLSYVDGSYQDNSYTSQFYVEQTYDENGNLVSPGMYTDHDYAEDHYDDPYEGNNTRTNTAKEYRNGLHLVENTAPSAANSGDMSQYNTINLQKVVAESMKELFPDDNDDVFAEDREKYNSGAEIKSTAGDTRIFTGIVNPDAAAKQSDDYADVSEESTGVRRQTGRVNIAQMVTGVMEKAPEPHTGAIKKVLVPGDDARSIKSDSDIEELRDTTEKSVDDEHSRMEYNDENVYHERSIMGEDETGETSQPTGPMKLDEVLVEWERMKQDNAKKHQEEIKKRVLTQTGKIFADFDNSIKSGILGELEREEEEAERRNQKSSAKKSDNGFLDADVTGDLPPQPASDEDFDVVYVTENRQTDQLRKPAIAEQKLVLTEQSEKTLTLKSGEHTQDIPTEGTADYESGIYPEKIDKETAAKVQESDGYGQEVGRESDPSVQETTAHMQQESSEDTKDHDTEEVYIEKDSKYIGETDTEDTAGAYTGALYAENDREYVEEAYIENNDDYAEDVYTEYNSEDTGDIYTETDSENTGDIYMENAGENTGDIYMETDSENAGDIYAEDTGAYTEELYVDENAYRQEDTTEYTDVSYEGDPYTEEPDMMEPDDELEDAYSEPEDDSRYADRRRNDQYNEKDLDPEDAESIAEMAKEDALKTQEIKMNTADLSALSERIVATTKKEASGAKREEVRDFTPEEQTLFENFAVTRKIKKQIVYALENMTLAAYTGNVIITGDAGIDTVRMAKNLVKEYQTLDEGFSGKLAKITGEKINQRNIKDIFEKLNNGGIIIEKANGMSEEKLYELATNLNQDTLGIVVIMEDTKKEITKLLEKQAMIVDYFNIRIDLMEMDNNALVAYAKNYALALEYSIDELGTLALYTRIANMQSGNHVVTKDEVRDIIDEAIWKSKKSKIKNFVDVLFARRYDNEDMIVLKERDFM